MFQFVLIVMRRLYNWTVKWADSSYAHYALFIIAFIESSFFPIPPDVLLIAISIVNPKKWWLSALVCTLGSLCGSYLGYFIGWGLYQSVGKIIVDTYNLHNAVDFLGKKYLDNAFLTVFTAAFTPLPYKAITITAGLFKIPIWILSIASLIGRGARFFLVAGALRIFGKKISLLIEKYFDIFSIIFVLLLVGGFIFLKRC
ncbi:MAG: DedA family protein [Candidatus Omnitrophica bacterium]|nr:DedA family protein [Candidatus Omnitrophota bacterium]MCM8827332.1 DedA family protein [Candidatus Omnitrophota bacterium]